MKYTKQNTLNNYGINNTVLNINIINTVLNKFSIAQNYFTYI